MHEYAREKCAPFVPKNIPQEAVAPSIVKKQETPDSATWRINKKLLFTDHSGSTMMLDLHIEGAAPVTLLVRDESRSTRSTSFNKDDDLDLDFPPSCDSSASVSSKRPRLRPQPRTTSSDEAVVFEPTLEDVSEAANLTIEEEMASFEFIDELAASVTSSSSMASDFDVWSPVEAKQPAVTSDLKSRFLSEAKNWTLAIPVRRASAESLSSYCQSPKTDLQKNLPGSLSVTSDLSRIATASEPSQPQPQDTSFQNRRRNCAMRQSKLVRQSKVDDHREDDGKT